MSGAEVDIRSLHDLNDLERCIEMQKAIWGFEDIDVVPLPMFVVATKVGGQVFGAFHGEEMIGFALAVPGYRHGRLYLHSHMVAALPAWQGKGIGRRLKLRQRAEALDRGIELVEWTFDPLEFRNAHFNLERLGVICRRYVRNQYGVTTSPLHGGLPTDRLVAEWWLASPRVKAIVEGTPTGDTGEREGILVPNAIHEKKQSDRETAQRMQADVREKFESWFARGYAATGFERGDTGGVYLLEPFEETR